MSADRLSLALASGAAIFPPSGRIAAFFPTAGTDLSALPRDRLHVVQPIRPDHDSFAAAGYDTAPVPDDDAGDSPSDGATPGYAAAIVFLPRVRAAARAAVARAVRLTGGGPLVIDGQKTDGIDTMLREARARGHVAEVLSKAHGKIFTLTPDLGADWPAWEAGGAPRPLDGGLSAAPGGFSADGPDPGSQALAAALAALPRGRLAGRVADLGAGWGYLSRAALDRPEVAEVHLVEADHGALSLAQAALGHDPRARFHWADATAFVPDTAFDAVVTNPPFHRGRTADPGLGRAFVLAAARMLRPSGVLYLVANRHLPYEATLAAAFAEVSELPAAPGTHAPGYKLIRAARPRRSPAR
jgi:16S rRNA (guanine1207-N2)-methyltransferase